MNSEEKKSIAAKIRALQSKTLSAGASEAEALAAAGKARELLDKYQMELDDVELLSEGFPKVDLPGDYVGDLLVTPVARFCDCRGWTNRGKAGGLSILGAASDVEFATWLLGALRGMVNREAMLWSLDQPEALKSDVVAFKYSAAARIVERLREAKIEPEEQNIRAENALTIRKGGMVNNRLAELGINLRPANASRPGYRGEAMAAGTATGNAAQFNRPIGTSAKLKALR